MIFHLFKGGKMQNEHKKKATFMVNGKKILWSFRVREFSAYKFCQLHNYYVRMAKMWRVVL